VCCIVAHITLHITLHSHEISEAMSSEKSPRPQQRDDLNANGGFTKYTQYHVHSVPSKLSTKLNANGGFA